MKRRYIEIALVICGAALIAQAGWQFAGYAAFEHHPEWFRKSPRAVSANPAAMLLTRLTFPSTLSKLQSVQVLGRLDVLRLGLSVLVVEGDDEDSLSLAAGHVPGTAAIGAPGNAVIAGHRDSAFRPLRKIRSGDRIRIKTDRTYEYIVSGVSVVNPSDTRVMNSTQGSTLTMVTCYPFRFLGDAPERYIVRAKLVDTPKKKSGST